MSVKQTASMICKVGQLLLDNGDSSNNSDLWWWPIKINDGTRSTVLCKVCSNVELITTCLRWQNEMGITFSLFNNCRRFVVRDTTPAVHAQCILIQGNLNAHNVETKGEAFCGMLLATWLRFAQVNRSANQSHGERWSDMLEPHPFLFFLICLLWNT